MGFVPPETGQSKTSSKLETTAGSGTDMQVRRKKTEKNSQLSRVVLS